MRQTGMFSSRRGAIDSSRCRTAFLSRRNRLPIQRDEAPKDKNQSRPALHLIVITGLSLLLLLRHAPFAKASNMVPGS